jgi:cation diffusion facilitator CzcD-associated flavoprotein CzcO
MPLAPAWAARPASGLDFGSEDITTPENKAILEKYEQERLKRLRPEGLKQFITSPIAQEYNEFYKDIWADENGADPGMYSIKDGDHHEITIIGAGYGGLLSAARLIQAGVDVSKIRLVDEAGGYGGTWWYNRYPGLMCDVESYIYMPLLEELGYMPKHKYSYGPELRQHADNIASFYNLKDKTLFQARLAGLTFDDATQEWKIKLESSRTGNMSFKSRFVVLASTGVPWPKLAKLDDFTKYRGHIFHTARWDWKYTGGSEENPDLTGLKGKKVAIIGTGATAIQIVPHLAKWAKELYIFQRTPSAVDVRGQQLTDAEWWKTVASKPGWQRARKENFAAIVNNAVNRPSTDMVADGWTSFPSYSGVTGNEHCPSAPEDIVPYVELMSALDLTRSKAVRRRVEETVKDPKTAEALKAWYPGWCKRPCFHDDYLPAFNSPNVHLIDTDGRGVSRLTETGVFFEGKSYDVDLLIMSTGYEIPVGASVGERMRCKIIGAGGKDFDDKWANNLSTLHGIQTNGFPNLFWTGLVQTGATPNQVAMVDHLTEHIAFVMAHAYKKMGSKPFTIQPTVEAEENWVQTVIAEGTAFATMGICPPSYFNGEGDLFRKAMESEEAAKKMARGTFWPRGLNSFVRKVQSWRDETPMEGFEVKEVARAHL